MANYATLKSDVQQNIKQNGNNEITGQLLQQQLLAIINSLGAGYQFAGVAMPDTDPGTPDQRVFYIAAQSGTYVNFGSLEVQIGVLCVFVWSSSWQKIDICTTRRTLYLPNAHPNYETDIQECYIVDLPAGTPILKCYSNRAYLYVPGTNYICFADITNSNNGDIIPIVGPTGNTAGYVIFRNIDHFRSVNTGDEWSYIDRSLATDKSFSPTIQTYLLKNITDKFSTAIDFFYKNSTIIKKYTISDFLKGYTNTNNLNIGDVFTPVQGTTPVGPSSAAGQLTIPVKTGDSITVRMKATSNAYCQTYVLLDTTYHILSWVGKTNHVDDWLDTPHEFNIENDGYLVLQFTQADYNANLNAPLSIADLLNANVYDTLMEIIENIPIFPVQEIAVCVPSKIYAIVGDTLQLYYRSIFRCVNVDNYDVNVICSIGAQYPRYFEITPTSQQVGTYDIQFIIRDNNGTILGQKTSTLVVKAVVNAPSSSLNVLCLGASATNGGQWAGEMKRRLTGSGGSPAGKNLSNINFVGRMSVTYNGQQVNLEATGGYSFPSYTSALTARFRFYIAAGNEPTVSVGDVYSNNGNNYTVREINISPGEGGNISCDGTGQTSGNTLTRVSGTGSLTITFTSASFSGNPFVYNGQINMQQYANDYCGGRIDVICTELFGNGTSPYMTNFAERMSQMRTFINQARAAFPNVKFFIGTFWNPDIRGGMGANYGAVGGWSLPYGIKFSNLGLVNALQKYIDDNGLSDYVYLMNWENEFDEENDFQQRMKKLNVRMPDEPITDQGYLTNIYQVKGIFGVNGVHPSQYGYFQLADTAYRMFVSLFCQ